MSIEPKPMDPDKLAAMALEIERCAPVSARIFPVFSWAHVKDLLADRAWHRAQVQVTDDHVRAAGLGDPEICEECPRLVTWTRAQPDVHYVDGTNDSWDVDQGGWRHGFWTGDPREAEARFVLAASPMAHDHIINALAKTVGRAPLDVLAEIAATEVSGE